MHKFIPLLPLHLIHLERCAHVRENRDLLERVLSGRNDAVSFGVPRICIYDPGERHVLRDAGHESVLGAYRVYRDNNETHTHMYVHTRVTSVAAARCQISEVFALPPLRHPKGGQSLRMRNGRPPAHGRAHTLACPCIRAHVNTRPNVRMRSGSPSASDRPQLHICIGNATTSLTRGANSGGRFDDDADRDEDDIAAARVTFSQIHLRAATRVIPSERRNSLGFAAERIYGAARVFYVRA